MIVSLEHVFKYYGADCILRDVNAAINEKDRIGLVGANGEGKTTLLNVLTGGLDYEEGSVSLTNGKVIGYLHQNSGLSNGRTIQQEMEAVFADLIALGQEVDALQKQMAQVHDNPQEYERVSAEYQKKLARFEARDGYQIEVKINTVLNGMGFGNYDRNIVTNNLRSPAAPGAGPTDSGRADQPPGFQDAQLAGGLSLLLQGRTAGGLARPLFLKPSGRPHLGAGADGAHHLPRELFLLCGAEKGAGGAAAQGI